MLCCNSKEKNMDNDTYISYGYDRHYRSWCVIVFGKLNEDLDIELESSYVGTKSGVEREINDYKLKYNTNRVEKVKAY
jgi:hypothetical protein